MAKLGEGLEYPGRIAKKSRAGLMKRGRITGFCATIGRRREKNGGGKRDRSEWREGETVGKIERSRVFGAERPGKISKHIEKTGLRNLWWGGWVSGGGGGRTEKNRGGWTP